jgi:hypothetical protein
LGNFRRFLWIFGVFGVGLGAFCNYFLEAKGLALIFPND